MFNVTYEIVTTESAENGDVEEKGFIGENMDLRTAIDCLFETRTGLCDGCICIEPSDSEWSESHWITVQNGMEYETGAYESRSLHFPDHVTPSSRVRIIRLIRGY